MSAALEVTYRRALRWFPKRWRAENEDAAVGTLLDQADDEQRSTPAKGEISNLRSTGAATRLGLAIPRAVRERSALIALALASTIAAAGIVTSAYMTQHAYPFVANYFHLFGPFQNVGVIYYAVWVVAVATALIGLPRVTTAIVAATIPLGIATSLIARATNEWDHPRASTLAFLGVLAVLYLIGRPSLRRASRVPFALIVAGLWGTFALIAWAKVANQWGNGTGKVDYFWGEFAVWLSLPGIPAVIITAVVLWRMSRSPWAPAMLLAAVPTVPIAWLEAGYSTTWLDGVAAAITVVVALVLVFLVLRAFGVRVRFTRS